MPGSQNCQRGPICLSFDPVLARLCQIVIKLPPRCMLISTPYSLGRFDSRTSGLFTRLSRVNVHQSTSVSTSRVSSTIIDAGIGVAVSIVSPPRSTRLAVRKVMGRVGSEPRITPTPVAVTVYSVSGSSPLISHVLPGAATRQAGVPSANVTRVLVVAGPSKGNSHVRVARLHQFEVAWRLRGGIGAASSLDTDRSAAIGSTIPVPKLVSHPGAPRS